MSHVIDHMPGYLFAIVLRPHNGVKRNPLGS